MSKINNIDHGLSQNELKALLDEYQFAITDEIKTTLKTNNPIFNQFVPRREELDIKAAEISDPIGDDVHSPVEGLIHRYKNRVLWKIAATCAVYCRFCFRKEHIGNKGEALSTESRQKALGYIAQHIEIEEVILSGGDPLTFSPKRLRQFIEPLKDLQHIRRLRIHSRIPVVQPEWINEELLALFDLLPQSKHLVIHTNHALELTPNARAALKRLKLRDVLLFSQTVLLKGVNDNVETLANLMNELLDCGVAPYYLHHLDLARGTNHFRLTLDEGLALESALRQRLSGIAMPTYIVEIPHGVGKVPVIALTLEQRKQLNQLGIF